jgi:hypothetical protein
MTDFEIIKDSLVQDLSDADEAGFISDVTGLISKTIIPAKLLIKFYEKLLKSKDICILKTDYDGSLKKIGDEVKFLGGPILLCENELCVGWSKTYNFEISDIVTELSFGDYESAHKKIDFIATLMVDAIVSQLPKNMECFAAQINKVEDRKITLIYVFKEKPMSTQTELPKYVCHKTVHALKIKLIYQGPNGHVMIQPEEEGYADIQVDSQFMLKHSPYAGGYYVVYKDGYQSFSPAAAFEEGYTREVE